MELELHTIAEIIKGTLHGDPAVKIKRIVSFEEARAGDITLIRNENKIDIIKECKASAYIIPANFPDLPCNYIKVKDISSALAKLIPLFYPEAPGEIFVSKHAFISNSACFKNDVTIYPFVFLGERVSLGSRTILYPVVSIGNDVIIGDDCILYPSVVIYNGVEIGNRVIIHSGTVIGADGFGYAKENAHFIKIKHEGKVVIEDEVEIGANTCVDKATLGKTIIKKGTKIDNLVQIGHNCTVGENCAFAAMVGLSGSTTIGNRVMMGGKSGTSGHLEIGDDVIIGAQAGVIRTIPAGSQVMGTPAIDLTSWKKNQVLLSKLPELLNKLKELEEKIEILSRDEG